MNKLDSLIDRIQNGELPPATLPVLLLTTVEDNPIAPGTADLEDLIILHVN